MPVKVFVSYSHLDQHHVERLRKHLTILERGKDISIWGDWQIEAGGDFDSNIKDQLAEAEIILLLISANFFASEYIWKNEFNVALDRNDQQTARVIPVIIEPCVWKNHAKLGRLKAVPNDGKAVSLWSNQEQAWEEVAQNIRKAAEKLRSQVPVFNGLIEAAVAEELEVDTASLVVVAISPRDMPKLAELLENDADVAIPSSRIKNRDLNSELLISLEPKVTVSVTADKCKVQPTTRDVEVQKTGTGMLHFQILPTRIGKQLITIEITCDGKFVAGSILRSEVKGSQPPPPGSPANAQVVARLQFEVVAVEREQRTMTLGG